MKPRILVFDSGVGGLSVARAVLRRLPDANVAYAADNEGFPYGDWSEGELNDRICRVIGGLIEECRPSLAVIACNTASTVALERLRRTYGIPFVGTVPAIKPASETSVSGIIGVLATPGTVNRAYTRALIDTFASHREVVLHGCKRLADMAERVLRGEALERAELAAEIAPVFKTGSDGRRTDTVVLGCTHYPLIFRLQINPLCV
ncbi:MAG: glutamate racemase [Pseudomonadota bacterium]